MERQLLDTLERKSSPEDENLVSAILGELKSPQTNEILLRYLNEDAYPNGGQTTTDILLQKFRNEEPSGNAGWYEIHAQACNELRANLFALARAPGPSQQRARVILMKLEEGRQEIGRPSNEPRHPAIESGIAWPQGLYVV